MPAQRPDIIIVRGKKFQLYSNPLESYWTVGNKSRPEFCADSYCKRGYIASWEIRNNRLYLTEIDGYFLKRSIFTDKKKIRYTLQTLFPNFNGEPIPADWFSGKLRIPYGAMKYYAHNGYDSRFEKEILISVEQGRITKEVILDFINHSLLVQANLSTLASQRA
jgi:hypothetical protein